MQPTCKKTPLLSALVDNELTGRQKDALLAHMENCPVCQKEIAALKQVDHLVREIPQIEPSTGFNHQFWTRAEQADRKKAGAWHAWLFNWRSMATAGLSAGLAVGLYLGIFYHGNNDVPINQEDLFMAENLEFLSDYEVLNHLELLEYWDAINAMKDHT